ncbi:amidohydrolase family protein [Streptomyces sp. NPDC029041]|uniref:amidohydrolase family protein n=1 Tax=Streptomyces sp. NPDC029041 TaxID=3155727 RepID=UPI0033E3F1DB
MAAPVGRLPRRHLRAGRRAVARSLTRASGPEPGLPGPPGGGPPPARRSCPPWRAAPGEPLSGTGTSPDRGPGSSPDPLQAIHVAVNRISPEAPADTPPFFPEQRLDLGTALAACTAGSAHVNHLDGITGSIAVGKAADLVVLDRDPFAGPPQEIAATRVLETFVEGRRVHAAA